MQRRKEKRGRISGEEDEEVGRDATRKEVEDDFFFFCLYTPIRERESGE